MSMDDFTKRQLQGDGNEGEAIPFERLTDDDKAILDAISMRAHNIVRDFKKRTKRDDLLDPDRLQIQMDIASIHVRTPLDLRAFLTAPVDVFAAEWLTIAQNINRKNGRLPTFINLRFRSH